MMKKTLLASAILLASPALWADWSGLINAAANIAAQKAGVTTPQAQQAATQAAQQAAAQAAANASAQAAVQAQANLGSDPATIQKNLGLLLQARAQASGTMLTPAQQQALAQAYAEASAGSYGVSAQLSVAQQQALIKQGITAQQLQVLSQAPALTPQQLQALAQSRVNAMTPAQRAQYQAAQAQALAAAQAQLQAQAQAQVSAQAPAAATTPCQPAQSKTAGLGGMFGKMAGNMLKSGMVPGVSAEVAGTAAAVAENAGAMADCAPAK